MKKLVASFLGLSQCEARKMKGGTCTKNLTVVKLTESLIGHSSVKLLMVIYALLATLIAPFLPVSPCDACTVEWILWPDNVWRWTCTGDPKLDPTDEFYIHSPEAYLNESFVPSISGIDNLTGGVTDIGIWNYEYTGIDQNGLDFPTDSLHYFLINGSGITDGKSVRVGFDPEVFSQEWYVRFHDVATDTWSGDVRCSIAEPSTFLLLVAGLAGLGIFRRKMRK